MDALYRLFGRGVRPFLPSLVQRRLRRGKEHSKRYSERFGLTTLTRPIGKLVWLHGASVGETLSALPLIERILMLHPEWHLLVTSGTVTSADLLAKRLPPRAFHQFIPLDSPLYVQRFFEQWKPDAVLWLESELWPCLLAGIRQRRIPAALVNARLSARSAKNWQWMGGWMKTILSTFSVVLAQSKGDAERLRLLGANNVKQEGNLKFTSPALTGSADSLSQLLATVGTRPRWIMASTHEGEEAIAAQVHQRLRQRWPELLTIIVPRHPNRAESIVTELSPFKITRRSEGKLPTRDTEIYLADTLGELGTLYSAAPIACVGKSFAGQTGGHNPIEPAQCGCAVLAGADMSNFKDIAEEMGDALVQVATPDALAEEVAKLLSDTTLLATRQNAGKQVTRQQEKILSAVLAELTPVLSP